LAALDLVITLVGTGANHKWTEAEDALLITSDCNSQMSRLKRPLISVLAAFVILLAVMSLMMALRADPEALTRMPYSAVQFCGGVVLGPLGVGLLVWLWDC
jgi:hypothetical protein